MKTFTAKQLHDSPSEVYRAAVKEPVKITHKHHGDFLISKTEKTIIKPCLDTATGSELDSLLCIDRPKGMTDAELRSMVIGSIPQICISNGKIK